MSLPPGCAEGPGPPRVAGSAPRAGVAEGPLGGRLAATAGRALPAVARGEEAGRIGGSPAFPGKGCSGARRAAGASSPCTAGRCAAAGAAFPATAGFPLAFPKSHTESGAQLAIVQAFRRA